jgi:hypothetical protein
MNQTSHGNSAKYLPAIRVTSSNVAKGGYDIVVDGVKVYGPTSYTQAETLALGFKLGASYYEHPFDLCRCGYSRNLHDDQRDPRFYDHVFELDTDCTHGVARSTPCLQCTAANEA